MKNFNFGLAVLRLTIILNLLPSISIVNFWFKKTNFDNIPSSKIFANYLNCLIWYFYGSIIFNKEIILIFQISGIISFVLIIIYLLIESKIYFLDCFLNCIILVLGTMSSYEWFGYIIIDKDNIGLVCLITTILSILTQVPDVYITIKEKNNISIRINYSIISFPTYLSWIIFGFTIKDKYVSISNLIGIFSDFIIIIIYFYYKKEYQTISDEEPIRNNNNNEKESKNETTSYQEQTVEIINLK